MPKITACLLFLAIQCAYLATAGGSLATEDAVSVFWQTSSLVERGALDVPREVSSDLWRGVDGRYHLPFGIGQAIYNVPFYAVGKALIALTGVAGGIGTEPLLKAIVAMGNTVAGSIAATMVFLLAGRVTTRPVAGLVAAGLFAFGTPAWTYSMFGHSAMVVTAALTVAVYGVYAGITTDRLRPLAWGSAALAFAFLTRHEMALAAAVVLIWVARTGTSGRRLLQTGVASCALVPSAALWMAFNRARFGSIFDSGHHPAFDFGGLAGFLFSPAGSLAVYCPLAVGGAVALIQAWRTGHPFGRLAGLMVVVLFGFYASLDDWLGTRSYGPRYLVPLLPFLSVAIPLAWTGATRLSRLALVCLATLSVVVQIPGVVVNFAAVRINAGAVSPSLAPYSWSNSPLVLNTRAVWVGLEPNLDSLLSGRTHPSEGILDDRASDLSQRLSFSFDFWWLYLYHLGRISNGLALAIPLILLVSSALFAAGAYRTAAATPPPVALPPTW